MKNEITKEIDINLTILHNLDLSLRVVVNRYLHGLHGAEDIPKRQKLLIRIEVEIKEKLFEMIDRENEKSKLREKKE